MTGPAGAFISIINLLIRAVLLEARLSAGISLNTFLTPYHRTTGRIIQLLHRFSRSVKKVKTNFLKKIIALTRDEGLETSALETLCGGHLHYQTKLL